MASYKWGYKYLMGVIIIVTYFITPLLTTHEPPGTTPVGGSLRILVFGFRARVPRRISVIGLRVL